MSIILEYCKSLWRSFTTRSLLYIDKNYFYRSHFIYIVVIGFIGACLLRASESNSTFLDCLYQAYSSITCTGLAVFDVSKLTWFSQILTLILTQLGSAVMLTLPVVLIKRYYIKRAFDNRFKRSSTRNNKKKIIGDQQGETKETNSNNNNNEDISKLNEEDHYDEQGHVGVIVEDEVYQNQITTDDDNSDVGITHHFSSDEDDHSASIGLDSVPTDGSLPHPTDKTPLGMIHSIESNIEYRSLGKLLYIIPIYQIAIYMFGMIILGSLVSSGSPSTVMRLNNVNGWWWSFFNSISAFNNSGLTILTDNMVQLNNSPLILLTISLLIAMGNTLYPVFLRLIIWVLKKVSKDPLPYEHLLENPRAFYTHLFQGRQTWILLLVWFIFTVSQMSLMAILESNDRAFEGMTRSNTFFNYLFQSVSTRTGGFNSIDINKLSSSVLLLFVGLMFVSSYPFAISLRGSAVNGKYSKEELKTKEVMKDLLIRDIFIIYICILLIGIFEESRLDKNDYSFSVFQIMFEVISAFGCVGLSMGYPGSALSFSSTLKTTSKLVVIMVMLLGKHRLLPDSIDNAIHIKEKAVISKLLKRKIIKRNQIIDHKQQVY